MGAPTLSSLPYSEGTKQVQRWLGTRAWRTRYLAGDGLLLLLTFFLTITTMQLPLPGARSRAGIGTLSVWLCLLRQDGAVCLIQSGQCYDEGRANPNKSYFPPLLFLDLLPLPRDDGLVSSSLSLQSQNVPDGSS